MAGSKLRVGNFAPTMTKEELGAIFAEFGRVRQVEIIRDKGFGFVEMFKKSEAKKAAEALDGSDYEGHTLEVREAQPFRGSSKRRRR